MNDESDLMHERINIRGEIENIRAVLGEREKLYDERFAAQEKALALQAREYERRLHDLNGEYKRDRERQKDYVTIDKYEDKLASEQEARENALTRVDERFEDYIKRYEARQREVDLLLTAQKAAAEAAKYAAEEQGRRALDATNAQARKTNRNLGIVSLVLGVIVVVVNVALTLIR